MDDYVPYTEIQVHGGVTVDDIAEVLFWDHPPDDIVAQLAQRNIPWRIVKP